MFKWEVCGDIEPVGTNQSKCFYCFGFISVVYWHKRERKRERDSCVKGFNHFGLLCFLTRVSVLSVESHPVGFEIQNVEVLV